MQRYGPGRYFFNGGNASLPIWAGVILAAILRRYPPKEAT